MFPFRIGMGYDVHQLGPGLPLRLGGVDIPHNKGAIGHSDADVLIHALCDALLGAAGLPDIGQQFPDISLEFKGIDSRILLGRTFKLIKENGWRIGNVDCTIALQKPKIAEFIPAMRNEISQLIECSPNSVSVKATTTEKLGFVGREEGVAAWAVAIVYKHPEEIPEKD